MDKAIFGMVVYSRAGKGRARKGREEMAGKEGRVGQAGQGKEERGGEELQERVK